MKIQFRNTHPKFDSRISDLDDIYPTINAGWMCGISDINHLISIADRATALSEMSITSDDVVPALQFSINPAMIGSGFKRLSGATAKIISDRQLVLNMHAKYVYNFARKNVPNQIDSLIHEVNWATQLGCNIVIHQGKNVATEKMSKLEAINNYVRNVSEVVEQTADSESLILLENSAAQGTELGSTLDQLAYIYNQFDDQIKPRIGFCIDTCHIFCGR